MAGFSGTYTANTKCKSGNVQCQVVTDWFDEKEHEYMLHQIITDVRQKKC